MAPTLDQRRLLIQAAAFFVNAVVLAVSLYAEPFYNKIPHHTSALSGHAWVQELLTGHPLRIKTELGMRVELFHLLVHELREIGLEGTCNITLEEQLAIFLYTCVTGLSIRHVGEHFQHANATISR